MNDVINRKFSDEEKKNSIDQLTINVINNPHVKVQCFSDEVVKKNLAALQDYANQKENCNNCKGIKTCKNSVIGFFTKITGIYDKVKIIKTITVKCEHRPGKMNINHSNIKNISHITVEEITQNEERKPIIEHFKNIYNEYRELGIITEKGMLLYGDFGTGKSYMTYAFCNKLNEKGLNVSIVFAPDLFTQIKNNKNVLSDIEFYKTIDVLLIDDLFSNNFKTWNGINDLDDVLLPILNYRMENNKLTFITTNLTEEQIIEKATKYNGSKIDANRLLERIKKLCEIFILDGKNLRERDKNE